MSKTKRDLSVIIGFRLGVEEVRKLNKLSEQTGRPRAELLRRLVDLAQAPGAPDLALMSTNQKNYPIGVQ
jgi:Ribbon-helix-helix protein, copG family